MQYVIESDVLVSVTAQLAFARSLYMKIITLLVVSNTTFYYFSNTNGQFIIKGE